MIESVPRQALAAYRSMTLPLSSAEQLTGVPSDDRDSPARARFLRDLSAVARRGTVDFMASLGGWAATRPGILAVLTGAGLWGLIAVEGLLGQLRPAEGSKSVPSSAALLTFAAAIGAFYLAGGFGELSHPSVWPWLVGLAAQFGMVPLIIAIHG